MKIINIYVMITLALVSCCGIGLSVLTFNPIILLSTGFISIILLVFLVFREYGIAKLQNTEALRIRQLENKNIVLQDQLNNYKTMLEQLLQSDSILLELGGAVDILSLKPKDKNDIEALSSYLAVNRDVYYKKARSVVNLFKTPNIIKELDVRIPYIELLFDRIIDYTEKSALMLLERFSGISEQAEKGAKEANTAMQALEGSDRGTVKDTSLEFLINESHNSIISRAALIQDFLKLNDENTVRITKISELVSKTEVLISGIDDIAERSKLITFNLAVESAKIGYKGLGFKVIVNELQKLNNQTGDFAHTIMEIVKSFNTYNKELLDHWILQSKNLTNKIQEDTEQTEKTVDALSQSYETTKNLFRSLSENAVSVNNSMTDILSSLQFQDITRQQIEGIEAFISDMKTMLRSELVVYQESDILFRTPTPEEIRKIYAPKLKVTNDHIIFSQISRS